MNPFAAYQAINTKLHAKQRVFFTDAQWHRLAGLRSVEEVVDFLGKKEGYKQLLQDNKITKLHRSELEVILDKYSVSEIEDLLHYYSGDYKQFFRLFLMQYEIEDLELILRTIISNDDMEQIEDKFTHSNRWKKANYQRLLSCKNVTQFLDTLKGTPYYEVLRGMTQEDTSKREFHMEMKLYMLYYKELINAASKLKPKDKAIALKTIGTKIDFINAQWIYRAMKYYEITPEEILIYSLSDGNKLTYQKLKSACYARNIEDCTKQLEKYLQYPLFNSSEDQFLSSSIHRYLYRVAKKNYKDDNSISAVMSYLYMLEVEISDIIVLVEGIRYGVPENELKKYLVHSL